MANGSGVALSADDDRSCRKKRVTYAAGDWDRVKQVFQAALEQSLETRLTFLDKTCGDDAALREEVESLLRAHEQAGSFAEHAAADGLAGRPLQRDDRLGSYEIIELWGAGSGCS